MVDESGRIIGRARSPSPTRTDPEPLHEALLACAVAALQGADVIPGDLDGIGVSAPGPMVWPAVRCPHRCPPGAATLRKRLAEEFEAEPVLVHNDAIGLTVGEHWKGAGIGTACSA